MKKDKEKHVSRENSKEELSPEAQAKIRELKPKAMDMAERMIAAYGKPVEEYDEIDRTVMAGLIFGGLYVIAHENDFENMDWIRVTMLGIAITKLQYSLEEGINLVQRMIYHSGPEEDVNLNNMIHNGIDAYYLLDKPEVLTPKLIAYFDQTHEETEKAWREGRFG